MFTACIITTITGSDIRIIMFRGNVYPTIYKFTVRINLRCRCTVTCITVTREVFAANAGGGFFGGNQLTVIERKVNNCRRIGGIKNLLVAHRKQAQRTEFINPSPFTALIAFIKIVMCGKKSTLLFCNRATTGRANNGIISESRKRHH